MGVDGNTRQTFADDSCTHTGHDNGAWWRVDLKKTQVVDAVHLYNRGDNGCGKRLREFEVRLSTSASVKDTSSATVCSGQRYSANDGEKKVIPCGGGKARYVFVVIPDRKEFLQLCEVNVVFKAASAPAPPAKGGGNAKPKPST